MTDKPQNSGVGPSTFRLQPQGHSTRKRTLKPVNVKPIEVWELPPPAVPAPKKLRVDGGQRVVPSSAGTIVYVNRQTCDASGQEFAERVQKLGCTLSEFANRTGLARSTVMYHTRKPAGHFPLWIMRLLEFEEMLAAIALALDRDRRPPGSRPLRDDLITLFNFQVDTIAGRKTPASRRS